MGCNTSQELQTINDDALSMDGGSGHGPSAMYAAEDEDHVRPGGCGRRWGPSACRNAAERVLSSGGGGGGGGGGVDATAKKKQQPLLLQQNHTKERLHMQHHHHHQTHLGNGGGGHITMAEKAHLTECSDMDMAGEEAKFHFTHNTTDCTINVNADDDDDMEVEIRIPHHHHHHGSKKFRRNPLQNLDLDFKFDVNSF